jgi:hypothetical protein
LKCLEGTSDDNFSQAAAPQFAANGETGQLAITCATPGAAIWYTLDDGYPCPLSVNTEGTARLYNDVIQLAVGQTVVRAAAYLTGAIASNVNRAVIAVTEA